MRHIVAIGGGGLSEPLLRRYVIELTGKKRPRVLYIPTAGGDAAEGIVMFYEAFSADGCRPSHLPLFNRREEPFGDLLLKQDVIYVGGGNTANMLAIWRVHGVDEQLIEPVSGLPVKVGPVPGSG